MEVKSTTMIIYKISKFKKKERLVLKTSKGWLSCKANKMLYLKIGLISQQVNKIMISL